MEPVFRHSHMDVGGFTFFVDFWLEKWWQLFLVNIFLNGLAQTKTKLYGFQMVSTFCSPQVSLSMADSSNRWSVQQGLVGECVTLSYVFRWICWRPGSICEENRWRMRSSLCMGSHELKAFNIWNWGRISTEALHNLEWLCQQLCRPWLLRPVLTKPWMYLCQQVCKASLDFWVPFQPNLGWRNSASMSASLDFRQKLQPQLEWRNSARRSASLDFWYSEFNQDLNGIALPEGLRTFTLGVSFNRSLDGVTLPAGLQTLTIGKSNPSAAWRVWSCQRVCRYFLSSINWCSERTQRWFDTPAVLGFSGIVSSSCRPKW